MVFVNIILSQTHLGQISDTLLQLVDRLIYRSLLVKEVQEIAYASFVSSVSKFLYHRPANTFRDNENTRDFDQRV